MGSMLGRAMSQTSNQIKKMVVNFGRIASGNHLQVNIQNTVDGEIRGLKTIAPYGISSCPLSGMFAQMMINGDTNSVFLGVHNPKAPIAKPGEIILYSSGGAFIKLGSDGVITIKGIRVDIG